MENSGKNVETENHFNSGYSELFIAVWFICQITFSFGSK